MLCKMFIWFITKRIGIGFDRDKRQKVFSWLQTVLKYAEAPVWKHK